MKTFGIIEDDPTIRENVILFIQAKSKFELTIESGSAEEFLEEVDLRKAPAILLLDIGLPGMSGIKAIPLIREKLPNTDIIMLTTYEEEEVIFDALAAGASSYISKRTSLVRILDAIQVVDQGGSYMSPSVAKKVIARFTKPTQKPKISLSERQLEIVKLMAKGHTYNDISKTCEISVNTVRTHIKRIYENLNVNSKYAVIRKWEDGELSD